VRHPVGRKLISRGQVSSWHSASTRGILISSVRKGYHA